MIGSRLEQLADRVHVVLMEDRLDLRPKPAKGGTELVFSCPLASRHRGGSDQDPSAGYNLQTWTWHCFGCGAGGGLIGGDFPFAEVLGIRGERLTISAEDRAMMVRRSEAARAEADREAERAQDALAAYWRALDSEAALRGHAALLDRLAVEGVPGLAAEHFGLGFSEHLGVDALVIPWQHTDHEGERHVTAVQYRAVGSELFPLGGSRSSKYVYRKGSRARLYHADAVIHPHDDTLLVVEGAKKAASMWGHGITSVVALPSKEGWVAGMRDGEDRWLAPFLAFGRVVFALDPDATDCAIDAARTLPNARVARVPMKVDDMMAASGGDVDVLYSYIEQARVV